MTEWRDVLGWEGFYQVNRAGDVRSLARSVARRDGKIQPFKLRMLKASVNSCGYLVVCLADTSRGRRSMARVHRLVAAAFLPNPDNLPAINHVDGDKKNPAVENLEWCSTKQNTIHSVAMRLQAITKLTDQQAMQIRTSWAAGATCKNLARQYFVHPTTIGRVVKGESYSWLSSSKPD